MSHRAPSPGDALDDPGYAGPAELVVDGRTIAVEVNLVGHYSPQAGRFHWYGRIAAAPEVTALGERPALLRTPLGEAETRLTDIDPWGRPRVSGYGVPPFDIPVDHPR